MNRFESDRREIEALIDEEIKKYDVNEHDLDDLAFEVVDEAIDRSQIKEELTNQTEYLISELRSDE